MRYKILVIYQLDSRYPLEYCTQIVLGTIDNYEINSMIGSGVFKKKKIKGGLKIFLVNEKKKLIFAYFGVRGEFEPGNPPVNTVMVNT